VDRGAALPRLALVVRHHVVVPEHALRVHVGAGADELPREPLAGLDEGLDVGPEVGLEPELGARRGEARAELGELAVDQPVVALGLALPGVRVVDVDAGEGVGEEELVEGACVEADDAGVGLPGHAELLGDEHHALEPKLDTHPVALGVFLCHSG